MSGLDQAGMDPLARKALLRLLKSADKHAAGIAVRCPALSDSALAAYKALRSLKEKEAFDAAMIHAQIEGAIKLQRPRHDPQGFIERIELVNLGKLALLLGEVPHGVLVDRARAALASLAEAYPVLYDVLACWEKLRNVRGTGPEDVVQWAMACEAIAYARAQVAIGNVETPVRDASSRLFKDSKRIERLVSRIDVLLSCNVEADARPDAEVLQELGLYREPQPVRMAGNIVVRRERGTLPLDRPYCALPSSTVLGLGSTPVQLLTIENQTTFHVWARQYCDSGALCLYTAGMPSPAWREMYLRLLADLPVGVPVLHWGDVDEGGFRIAAHLSQCAAEVGRKLLPWRMRPTDVPEDLRREAPARIVERMVKYAEMAGWPEIAYELAEAKIVAEQEG